MRRISRTVPFGNSLVSFALYSDRRTLSVSVVTTARWTTWTDPTLWARYLESILTGASGSECAEREQRLLVRFFDDSPGDSRELVDLRVVLAAVHENGTSEWNFLAARQHENLIPAVRELPALGPDTEFKGAHSDRLTRACERKLAVHRLREGFQGNVSLASRLYRRRRGAGRARRRLLDYERHERQNENRIPGSHFREPCAG